MASKFWNEKEYRRDWLNANLGPFVVFCGALGYLVGMLAWSVLLTWF